MNTTRLTSIVGGSIGNLIEWFDWFAYSAFSFYFAAVFFPTPDETVRLLNVAGIFAVGFLLRPLGGWFFGRYADRHGRKAALMISVSLMCAGSLLIAVTPGYTSIGLWAPAILILARLLQGFSVGGEYGASATYLSEISLQQHRGFYASFQYVTIIIGQLGALGLLIVLQRWLLTPEQLQSWGWRIPFVIGALGALLALRLRSSMEETESFANTRQLTQIRGSIQELFLGHPRAWLTVVGLTMGGSVAFYTYTTYMQKFLVATAGMSKSGATLLNAATLVVFMFLQPLLGALSDRIGRRPILIGFGVLGTLCTVPLMSSIAQIESWWAGFVLVSAALLIVSGYTAVNAVVKAELFPAHIRALGVSLPYALTVSIFGGTAEYIALYCKTTGHENAYYWYVTFCIACSLLVYVLMPDTRSRSRIDTEAQLQPIPANATTWRARE